MMRRNNVLGHVLGIAVLGVGILSTSSCEEDGGPVGDILDQCVGDLECPADGIAKGNAAITGYASVDTFFNSVVNFKSVANGVTADINAELSGIQADFGVSPADLKASGGKLDAAIKAKLDTTFKQKLVIKAQPAKCSIDAKFTAEASASCQAKAECEVDPGKASFECMGSCTVDASVEGKCEADAEVVCKVSAPDFMCMGTCEGSCTTKLMAAASCSGTCNGTCSGTCEGNTSTETGKCNGQCMGMCTGECSAVLEASAMCNGSCNGSCTYKPGSASCDARAKVECELKAMAEAKCEGRCDGEIVPPKVDCDASASCEASAKAEAKFQAKCTPPTVEIKWVSTGTVDAAVKAQFDYAMGNLKVRLPRLRAAMAKSELVVDAGAELGDDGKNAIKGTISALSKGKVDFATSYRIATCAPKELDASANAITMASGDLKAATDTAKAVSAAVGM